MAHYIMTPEIRKKLSESKLGDKNHMFGKKRTEESNGPARSFEDYVVNVNSDNFGEVKLIRKLG